MTPDRSSQSLTTARSLARLTRTRPDLSCQVSWPLAAEHFTHISYTFTLFQSRGIRSVADSVRLIRHTSTTRSHATSYSFLYEFRVGGVRKPGVNPHPGVSEVTESDIRTCRKLGTRLIGQVLVPVPSLPLFLVSSSLHFTHTSVFELCSESRLAHSHHPPPLLPPPRVELWSCVSNRVYLTQFRGLWTPRWFWWLHTFGKPERRRSGSRTSSLHTFHCGSPAISVNQSSRSFSSANSSSTTSLSRISLHN